MESLADLFFPWFFDAFLLLLDKPDRWLGLLCQQYAIASQLCLFFITCNYTLGSKITTQCLNESSSWKTKKQLSEVKPRKTDGILEAFLKTFIVCWKILFVKLIWTAGRVGMFSMLVLTPGAHPAASVNRYLGSYLAKMPLSYSAAQQPDLLFKYSSCTTWNSWLIMQSPLYLGNSTGIESDSASPQQPSLS